MKTTGIRKLAVMGALALLTACGVTSGQDHAIAPSLGNNATTPPQADRDAILNMAGSYRVTFDFTETVSLQEGYELKPQKISHAREVVFVIEDRPDFISLQHILVAASREEPKQYFPIKHWRQDWQWQPDTVLSFVGGNGWETQKVSTTESMGKWSQTVYQVDDAPRYSGLGAWQHTEGRSVWESARSWRPLPRRDATTRDDYQVISAVNRHAITPTGWVHEQDNTKLVTDGMTIRALAVEVGVNTYTKADDYPVSVATTYWHNTASYWADIRTKWQEIASNKNNFFALKVQGEPQELYMPLLELASTIKADGSNLDTAIRDARDIIDDYVLITRSTLQSRLNTDITSR
ncbi:hypothetical protein GCM10017044_06160 [Kordiimonas sediminis]|uniref:Uncharacterized protein n=1 Tax=Kordiimonas sediminis TaxID=1735581 RepID=A0A919E5M9_9PROT|nr:DUF6607 family protein [Kordiimonas sediminis]GHF14817.1 hypothetical protein GCM10017044_06160 [Kordiimonas sediminis]